MFKTLHLWCHLSFEHFDVISMITINVVIKCSVCVWLKQGNKKPREVCGKRLTCNSKLNLFNRLKMDKNEDVISQSINQPTNQSINHSTYKSMLKDYCVCDGLLVAKTL